VNLRCRPIQSWPDRRPANAPRKRAQFKATFGKTLGELERELSALKVSEVVLELDVGESDLRIDGWPRADARPRSPGVVLNLEHPTQGWLRFPCETYDRWEDNFRAIRLALEALRAVDRYGVTRRAEQFAGWRALPASTTPTMTTRDAAVVLERYVGAKPGTLAGEILTDPKAARWAAREAIKVTHPDRGGTAEAFNEVQIARRALAVAHGVDL
jgi:hypothetical protein